MMMRPDESCDKLVHYPPVSKALQFIAEDVDATTEEQITLTSIPAPTNHEERRGAAFAERLRKAGLEDVKVDPVGNVMGVHRGTGTGPRLYVFAHLDTVFPDATDVTARREGTRIYAPGISDNGRGLAVVLGILRALSHSGIATSGDVVFGATVGEEGLGDLRGVKALFANCGEEIDGYISVEPGNPAEVIYLATGSHRFAVTFHGPGGHSFGDFGTPSAIHAMGRAIALMADMDVPREPKTTFTVGTVSGGTSVNTIAQTATCLLDLRSNDEQALLALEKQALALLTKACDEENARWERTSGVTVSITQIGNRPAGTQSADASIVQTAMAAASALGLQPVLETAHSTDANIPIHLGVPAVTLGGGGLSGGMHTLEEFYDPTDSHIGVQRLLLTILALVGIPTVSDPLLHAR